MILSCPPPPEKKKKMTGIHTLNFLSLAGGVEVWTKNGMSPFTGLRQSLIFLCIVTARET